MNNSKVKTYTVFYSTGTCGNLVVKADGVVFTPEIISFYLNEILVAVVSVRNMLYLKVSE